ncbi:MAG: stage IV sporulation protein A [Clostridia bacterium]|nr:stage IV sporulation protein A [Clostridia bacterium]
MNNIYGDIATRTNGNIYIGVVGPVRTGKSTFITNFMQKLIVPNIENVNDKKRCIDELPQSADGRMIMTTQPKFVPDKAVQLDLSDKKVARVRMIDCVGYLVEGAEGHLDGDKQRLVGTPWHSEPIPFERAATIGTQKVATEHATVCVVVTTDGSIGDIARKNYITAEEHAVRDVKNSSKPFVIVLNTIEPTSEATQGLCRTLEEKYGVPVLPLDVANADVDQLEKVLLAILNEFPIRRLAINLPSWMRALPRDSKVIMEIINKLKDCSIGIDKIKESNHLCDNLQCEYIASTAISSIDCGSGTVTYNAKTADGLFFKVLSEEANEEIFDELSLMNYITASYYAKRHFETFKDAIAEADANGYGVVYPLMEQIHLDEPKVIKQGNIYGVQLTAKAPSYHIVKVDVTTDVSPMVGTEQQSQYLLDEYKVNPQKILNTNMFGRTMSGIASDGLLGKCVAMPTEVKQKLTRTVGRIVNENKGGLICILL